MPLVAKPVIVKMSSKNQIVIPKEARQALKLKAGTKLIVGIHDDVITIRRQPDDYAKALRGLLKGMYPPDYLEKERKEWGGTDN